MSGPDSKKANKWVLGMAQVPTPNYLLVTRGKQPNFAARTIAEPDVERVNRAGQRLLTKRAAELTNRATR
jgi:hypothetical protein